MNREIKPWSAACMKPSTASSASSMRLSASESVQVVVRCRPMNAYETRSKCSPVVEVDPKRREIVVRNPCLDPNDVGKTFVFDAVYDGDASQNTVYDMVRPMVTSCLAGFNGTIFAYGQTGTGKTYTMDGFAESVEKRGIIWKAIDQIFQHIEASTTQKFLVRTSYLEIYQEEIRDLLAKDKTLKCEIHERPDWGIYVKNLSSFACRSAVEIGHIVARGNERRTTASTGMNDHSSRSHAVLTITIEMIDIQESQTQSVFVGKLNLVDLAGSERQTKSQSQGQRFKETTKINLSLSALGNVISALINDKVAHIPYRDSKLTRLLQDSLGGNSKTLICANIGPASSNYEETLTTLRYANRAKNIKNRPKINEDPKDAQIREQCEEIDRLRKLVNDLKSELQFSGKSLESGQGDEELSQLISKSLTKIQNKMLFSGTKDEVSVHGSEVYVKEVEEKRDRNSRIYAELKWKFAYFEGFILRGGDRRRSLDERYKDIAEKKRLEVAMLEQLRCKEETTRRADHTYANLVEEVKTTSDELDKQSGKLRAVQKEIEETVDICQKERRDLREVLDELIRDHKLKSLIIGNLISPEAKEKFVENLIYDEESSSWLNQGPKEKKVIGRHYIKRRSSRRHRGENVLNLSLMKTAPTTLEYEVPVLPLKVLRKFDEAMAPAEDLEIDAARFPMKTYRVPVKREVMAGSGDQRVGKARVYPVARGLVPRK